MLGPEGKPFAILHSHPEDGKEPYERDWQALKLKQRNILVGVRKKIIVYSIFHYIMLYYSV